MGLAAERGATRFQVRQTTHCHGIAWSGFLEDPGGAGGRCKGSGCSCWFQRIGRRGCSLPCQMDFICHTMFHARQPASSRLDR